MKTWQFWVLIILVIFIVIPAIIYAVSVNAASKVVASNPTILNNIPLDASGYPSFAPPQKV